MPAPQVNGMGGVDGLFSGEGFAARLPVAAFRSTPEGRFIAANQAMGDLLRVSIAELQQIDVRSLYASPSRRDRMMARVEAGLVVPPEDLELRRPDGSTLWVRVTSSASFDPDGSVEYYEGFLEDVTEQRSVVARLAESNRLLDTLTRVQNRYITGADIGAVFDGLLDDLLKLTASEYGFIAQVLGEGDDRYLRTFAMTNIAWNDATRELYAKHGPRGMEFHNLDNLFGRAVTGAAPVLSDQPAQDSRRGGSPYGHPPLKSFLGLPLLKGGEVIGIVAVANRSGGYGEKLVDALEPFLATAANLIQAARTHQARLDAEQRAIVREQRFQAVVEAAVDGIVVFDADGVIEAFNLAAEQLFGVSESEMVGNDVRRLMPPDRVSEYEGAVMSSQGQSVAREMVLRHASGDEFVAEVSFGRAVLDDRTIVTAMIRDVSERKVTEDALHRARDLAERASRSKDEFLASMSHELRTPLNGIIGLSSILSRGTHGAVNEKQAEYLEHIESSGRHLLSLINDVLDLAKIEADKLEPDLGRTDLAVTIGEAAGIVRESAVAKAVTMEISIPDDLPIVTADARRIRQVILNLLSNAVKFTDSGGRIGLEARRAGSFVEVAVWDTGVGIPADKLDQLFVPFQQVDSSLSRRHEGTGLGLALSRRLIEAHGGDMAVSSRSGEGSTFSFRLPITATERSAKARLEQADPSATPLPGHRVLVVEDNEVNRMLVCDYLEAHGLDIAIASNGNEAIEQTVAFSPDVILMDIQMPHRDGLSATRELKAREDTKHIPVIALTALAMKGDADRCLAAGCDGYISKPADPEEILQAIRDRLPA
ncbi:MAG: PAS domain S-box protein [Acidimicrobiia bacterium]|nr:PAS domain S-box protein [Acidimicrobiia bacterium]